MNDETPELKNSTRTKSLCKKNCGFYGSIEFKDMCSKCYRETNSSSTSEDMPSGKLKDSSYGLSRSMKRKISETLDSFPCSDIKLKQLHQSSANSPQTQSPKPLTDSCISSLSMPKCISTNNNNCLPSDSNSSIKNQESNQKSNLISESCLKEQTENKTLESKTSPSNDCNSRIDCKPDSSKDNNASLDSPKKSFPNRCHICRKKVGLTGFVCHCEKLCCSLHRYPDQHSCGFDYIKKERAKIAQDNPVIQAAKINKI